MQAARTSSTMSSAAPRALASVLDGSPPRPGPADTARRSRGARPQTASGGNGALLVDQPLSRPAVQRVRAQQQGVDDHPGHVRRVARAVAFCAAPSSKADSHKPATRVVVKAEG